MYSELETLGSQYNVLLSQYKTAYDNYANFIGNDGTKQFKTIKNRTYTGDNLQFIEDTDSTQCIEECKKTPGCYGGTLDAKTSSCILKNKGGKLVYSDNSTAFIEEATFYANQMKHLNAKLQQINEKMMQTLEQNKGKRKDANEQLKQREKLLTNNYAILNAERNDIEKLLDDFNTLETTYENNSIAVTSNYYTYLFYLLVVIILSIVFIKVSAINVVSYVAPSSNPFGL
jgi:hypothetical protein